MADLSDYLEGAWLDTLLGGGGGQSFTAPAALYVQLHTGDPGEAGTSNVSAETDRKAITFSRSNSTLTSTNAQEWENWDAGSETISHISIWDASTSGNCIAKGDLSASKSVSDGDDFTLPSGSVTLSLD